MNQLVVCSAFDGRQLRTKLVHAKAIIRRIYLTSCSNRHKVEVLLMSMALLNVSDAQKSQTQCARR
jgi:hypothetical protein